MKLEKFAKVEERYGELEKLLVDAQGSNDKGQYQKLAKEYADATPIINALKVYKDCLRQMEELKKLLQEKHDAEFESLAKTELQELDMRRQALAQELNELTNPAGTDDDRNLIMEIRAGTGGEEASLFAGDLFRMYTKYAEARGWKVELM